MKSIKKTVVFLVGCALIPAFADAHAAELKNRDYSRLSDDMGVVLLDVNWGRQWNCAGNENAQLVSLRFENISQKPGEHDKYTEISLKTPSRLSVNPVFLNYGFLVEPGTYVFTEWSVKVSKSVNDIVFTRASREALVEGDVYHGGSFTLEAGEAIYIGNFFLDCYQSPIPWRYYSEGKDSFDRHTEEYKDKFKFLQGTEIEFRLLETENFGSSYELPE